MDQVMNNFNLWLNEEELKIDTITDMLKSHLGLPNLSNAAFDDVQISDFDNYDRFRAKIVGWNLFTDLKEIPKSTVLNLLKNQNTRMRDLVAAFNK
jgi:hypothetical protein